MMGSRHELWANSHEADPGPLRWPMRDVAGSGCELQSISPANSTWYNEPTLDNIKDVCWQVAPTVLTNGIQTSPSFALFASLSPPFSRGGGNVRPRHGPQDGVPELVMPSCHTALNLRQVALCYPSTSWCTITSAHLVGTQRRYPKGHDAIHPRAARVCVQNVSEGLALLR
jgi:hypothetical protein